MSSSSSSSHQRKHDVFVSFRGNDLRNNFISHLFHGLDQAGIDYFYDDNREDTGQEIPCKLSRAIRHSRFALIVFSTNYADSKWCLNELVENLECRRQLQYHGHVIVPIFHGVDTADISNLTGGSGFARGFERLCRYKRDDVQIQIWRDALAEAKHFSGFDLKNHVNGAVAAGPEMTVERYGKESAWLVENPQDKVRKFQDGLKSDLRNLMLSLNIGNDVKMLE
ncbi:TMV resistance protein N-like [Syzygium oleosum]|uniref:TMV resistance protein N-like n=1 Tax=Syzygium oleosum TaxID=219896 RepID=UPI0011D25081|nr:TMV resistance protein N-like [Syzygium oleosum]